MSFWSDLLGGAEAVGGIVAAPLTGGVSLGLTAAGVSNLLNPPPSNNVTQNGVANTIGNASNNLAPINTGFLNNYNAATGMNIPNYSSVMNSYTSFLNGQNPTGSATPSLSAPTSTGAPTSSALQITNPNATLAANGATDVAGITAQLTNYYQSLGLTPTGQGSGATDVAYYAQQIANTGGLTPQNAGYWQSRIQSDVQKQNSGQTGASGGSNGSAIGGWQNFAQTGGFTPQNIQDIRNAAEAPTRAIYQNAQNDLSTQMARTGGYMPNYGATQADLTRQANQGISAADVAAGSSVAQMQQQGQLYGLSGLTNAQLGALSGMTGMYGTSPGLTSTFGNQVLQGQSLANNLTGMNINAAAIPSNYQTSMGNLATGLNVGGALGNAYKGIMNNPSSAGILNPSSPGYNPNGSNAAFPPPGTNPMIAPSTSSDSVGA